MNHNENNYIKEIKPFQCRVGLFVWVFLTFLDWQIMKLGLDVEISRETKQI